VPEVADGAGDTGLVFVVCDGELRAVKHILPVGRCPSQDPVSCQDYQSQWIELPVLCCRGISLKSGWGEGPVQA